MKKIKILSALLMLFTFVGLISCDTEPVDPVLNDTQEEETTAVFKVDFNGATFEATTAAATIVNGGLAITGVKANGEAVGIVLSVAAQGTYTTGMMFYNPAGADFQYINANPEVGMPNGTVTITSINTTNHTVSGTFNFKGWAITEEPLNPIVFSNGTFENVPYTGEINPPTGDAYFKANIGGTMTNFNIVKALLLGEQYSLLGANANSSIDLRVMQNITPGTYEISDDFDSISAIYMSITPSNGYFGESGSLTIISNSNGWIKGTFHFTGLDMEDNPIEITNGEFNIKL